jgi:hypothetical protein
VARLSGSRGGRSRGGGVTDLDDELPRPRWPELLAVIALGAAHVVVELTFSLDASRIFNSIAFAAGLAYLVWRASTTQALLYRWGFRVSNFWTAFCSHLPFFACATVALLIWGGISGRLPLPGTFWVAALLYPFFGVAQQFIVQNLLMANLRGLIRRPGLCALAAAFLFCLSHLPRIALSTWALIAGFFLTLAYQRHPNLWAIGIVHGLLAALAFHTVFAEDPGARILHFIRGLAG